MTIAARLASCGRRSKHDADGDAAPARHQPQCRPRRSGATFLAHILLDRYPDRLATRYKFGAGIDGPGVLGRRPPGGCIRRPRRRTGLENVLLQDYRDGALGRISLETPQTRRPC
jgi:ribosome biogenesis GTPase A